MKVLRGRDRTHPIDQQLKKKSVHTNNYTIIHTAGTTYWAGVSGDFESSTGKGIEFEVVSLLSDEEVRRVDCFRLVVTEEVDPKPVVTPKPDVSPNPSTSPSGEGFALVGVPISEGKKRDRVKDSTE